MKRLWPLEASILGRRMAGRLCTVYALRIIAGWGFAAGVWLVVWRWRLGAAPAWAGIGVPAPLLAAGLAAAWLAARLRRPDGAHLLALLDCENRTGGLLSALGADGVAGAGWNRPDRLVLPPVRCAWQRPAQLALAGLLFAAGCLWLPLPAGAVAAQQRLSIGPKAAELQAEIAQLEKENLAPAEDIQHWREELARVTDAASGRDPAKTWEALDYLQEALADKQTAALQSAAEQGRTLRDAETAAAALAALARTGAMPPAEQAGAELALKDSLESAGGAALSPELRKLLDQAQAAALTPEQLQKLQELLRQAQANLQAGVTNLAAARLLSPEELQQLLDRMCAGGCTNGGCTNGAQVAAALCAGCQGQPGGVRAGQLLSACRRTGNGGPGGGGGPAALTWSGDTQRGREPFKAQALPPAALRDLTNAQVQGVSFSAAREHTNAVVTGGALAATAAGASRPPAAPVLPRHRRAVERYFERGTGGAP